MRWFTYCRITAYGSPVSVESGADRRLALLFGSDSDDDNVSLSDADALVVLPEIRKMYSAGCAVREVDLGGEPALLLTAASDTFEQKDARVRPDEANDETPKYIVGVGQQVFEYDLAARYNACTSMMKYMGCDKCDLLGYQCAGEAVPFLPDVSLVKLAMERKKLAPTIEAFKGYKDGVTQLGAFTFRKPSLTRQYGRPGAIRGYRYHSFRCSESVKEKHERSAGRASETRDQKRFEKDQCNRCFVQPQCFNRNFKWKCTGALPVEEIALREMWENNKHVFEGRNFTEKELTATLLALDTHSQQPDCVGLTYKGGKWWAVSVSQYSFTDKLDTYTAALKKMAVPGTLSEFQRAVIAGLATESENSKGYVVITGVREDQITLLEMTPDYYGPGHGSGYWESLGSLSDYFYHRSRLTGVEHGKYRPPKE